MTDSQHTVHTGLGARLCSNDISASSFSSLPVIDLTALSSPKLEDRLALAKQVQEACVKVGFMYISNHGVPQATIDKAFEQGKLFFSQPTSKKMEIDVHKGTSFKGYSPLKGEKVDPTSRGDVHEAFDMGADDQHFSDEKQNSGNQYPDEKDLPEFKGAVQEVWDGIMDLGKRLFPIFALALNLPEDYFADKLKNPGSTMRLLHYPPQCGEIDSKEIGIGAHTDYECFTILAQDSVAALQVLNSSSEWVHAPPIPGTFVLNLGDQLQRWSNDVFKSTVHRAINRTGKERMSLPFFFGVDYDAVIEVLPSCITEDRPAKYEPVKAGEYVEGRLAETYVKVGAEEEGATTGAPEGIKV